MAGEKYLKQITLLASIFILAGSCYLFVYYQSFAINIFQYIEFSEILTLIGQGIILTGSLAVVLILARTIIILFEFILFGIIYRKNFDKKRAIDFIIFRDSNRSMFNFLLTIAALIAFFFTINKANKGNLLTIFDFFSLAIMPTIFMLIFIGLFKQGRDLLDEQEKGTDFGLSTILPTTLIVPKEVVSTDILTIGYSICMVIIFSFFGFFNANLTHHRQNIVPIEIYNEDRIAKSSDDILYLGKTKNYFFFYDKLNNNAVVYSSDLKLKIQISSK